MSSKLTWVAATGLVAGIVIGWLAAGWWPEPDAAPEPDDWLARVGNHYITQDEFVAEMERRGGRRPGQFQSVEQRRELLDELMYQRALVQSAEAAGLDRKIEVRRSLDQILINQVIASKLRPLQEDIEINDAEIQALYEAEADAYAIPARKRLAMIHLRLPSNADPATRDEVQARAESVLAEAARLGDNVRDFGVLARDRSEHQASRYRGGVLGWIGEGAPERYSHPQVVLDWASDVTQPGQFSELLQDDSGYYIARVVDYEPRQARSYDDLADGIRQRLMREHYIRVEHQFKQDQLADASVELRPGAIEAIEPLSSPGREEPRQPPRLPAGSAAGGQ